MQNQPTFLGIGSQRCGTTWIAQQLRSHPDIFLSKEKELNFFSNKMTTNGLDWYFSQFDSSLPVRGEISPQYSRLTSSQVGRIAKLLPNIRSFLVIREPVSRTWSQACYELGFIQGRKLEDISEMRFLMHFERVRSKLYTDYYQTIRNWRDAFGTEPLYIETTDQFRNNPRECFKQLFDHIGANSEYSLLGEELSKKINTTAQRTEQDVLGMTDFARWYLSVSWLDKTRQLNDLLDGKISNWVSDMEYWVLDSPSSWMNKRRLNRLVYATPERFAYEVFDRLRDIHMRGRYAKFERQLRD